MTHTYRCWIAAAGCVLALTASPPAVIVQEPAVRGRLYLDSRAELALARARGETTVTLVIAARERGADTVARDVAAAGGTVRVKNDDVGYLRVEVPIDRADAVAGGNGVEAAAVDFSAAASLVILAGPRQISSDSSHDAGVESGSGPSAQDVVPAAQWSDAPFTKPYSPLKDLGAADLRRVHPTFDGRGITIGHVERTVDLLIPELETALTLDGRETPKIVDVRTTTDPDHTHGPDGRRIWTKMDLEVTAPGGRFTAGDATYSAPRDGRFRFGIFDGGGLCGTFLTRRNADAPPASACRFGILWDEQSREVWVDTTRDRSFADERALADFQVRRDIGTLGRDEPDTPEREQVSFTVQMDPAKRAVALNLGNGGHATSVASSAAGSRGARGRFEGVAPGARLINFDYGSECIAGVIEAFIAVVLAPIGEEILFRGFLYGGLSRKMNAFAAMAISSLVFAVSHQYSLTGLVFVFIYGLVFCWLYKRTGSLWPGILAHGLYNGLITWQGVAWYSFHG